MASKMVKGMAKGKGASVDAHSAATTVRRLARLEGLVDELVGANFPEQLESVRQKLTNEIMEREVQDKVLHTYVKTVQLSSPADAASSPPSVQGTALIPPPCSVAEAAELSAQQEVVRTQLFAFSQVFQRDLTSVQRSVTEIRERVEAAEVARNLAAKAESINSSVGAQTPSTQHSFCTDAQVESLVTEVLSKARASWRSDIERELVNVTESKAELGRTLVKEFERSIVGIHAKRLTAAEESLQSLSADLKKMRSSVDALSFTAYVSKETRADSAAASQHSIHSAQTQVEANFGPFHTEMQHLVGVVQGLQMQSEQVMGMLEQGKVALQKEVQNRMQEDQRIEGIVKEQLGIVKPDRELADLVGDSPNPEEIRKNLQEIISKVDGKRVRNSNDTATSGEPSTQGVGSASTSQASSAGKPQKAGSGESGHLIEDLRSTILTYFRSEFQDYVGETLQKMGSRTPSQIGTPQPPHPRMSAEVVSNVADLGSSVQSVKTSPRIDTTPLQSSGPAGGSLTLQPHTPAAKVQVSPTSPEAIASVLMGKTLRAVPGLLQTGATSVSRGASPTGRPRSTSVDVATDRLEAVRHAGNSKVAPHIEAIARRSLPFGIHQTVPSDGLVAAALKTGPISRSNSASPRRSAGMDSPSRNAAIVDLGSSVKSVVRAEATTRFFLSEPPRNPTPSGKSGIPSGLTEPVRLPSTSWVAPVAASVHVSTMHSPRQPSLASTISPGRQSLATPVQVQRATVLKARPVA